VSDIWSVVHCEREALIHELETLPPQQWVTPSLCPGWDIHDVLAHLVDDAKTTRLGFIRRFAAAGFDFDRCNSLGVERERAEDPGSTLARFRAVSGRVTSAPAPLVTRLVEAFVHGEDVRRPLGRSRDYPTTQVATALFHQVNTSVKMGGGKERVQGLRLVASDTNVDVGTGQDVHGTALALLLAVSGRPVGPEELRGPGASALRQ
jgi:uncharacterized protein (TIGR03083 family)